MKQDYLVTAACHVVSSRHEVLQTVKRKERANREKEGGRGVEKDGALGTTEAALRPLLAIPWTFRWVHRRAALPTPV